MGLTINGAGSMPIGTNMFEPVGSASAIVLVTVLSRLVGEIVAVVVVMTEVGKGMTEGFPLVCKEVPIEPDVAGSMVGVSVGVIVFDESVSAKTPPTDWEMRPVEPLSVA